jgi:nicotinate-nucleotide pyrophosphorylase (carboxylating)
MTFEEAVSIIVRLALEEDIGTGDVTTVATIPEEHVSFGRIVAKEEGVLAGMPVVEVVLSALGPAVEVTPLIEEGSPVTPGLVVATVEGPTRTILTGERTALNFLQRLSGVATAASRYAAEIEGTGATVTDTRKTTPGMRHLEKYAVAVGGGANHRMGLWDMALIKDNHIVAAGGIRPAVEGVRAAEPALKVEVEVTDLAGLEEAIEAGADRIMLDNMTLDGMREAIAAARAHDPAPEVEVSGGVTLEGLRAIAELGPDFISVGALTHSAPALDLSLDLEERS